MRKALWLLLLAPLFLASALSFAEDRSEALAEIKALIDKNQTRLIQIDSSITEALMKLRELGLAQSSPEKAKQGTLEKELENLSFQRREHILRQDFFDRISFQLDRHFHGGDLKAFLETKTLELAQTELSSQDPDTNMWKFLSYLSMAIKELPERHEAPFGFIEGYMRFSTLLNPVRPEEYLVMRNYTNGHDFESAEPMDADRVGEVVESKIREAQAQNQKEKLPFEQRKPFLKPIAQIFEEQIRPINTQPLPQPKLENFEPPQMLLEQNTEPEPAEKIVEIIERKNSEGAEIQTTKASPLPPPYANAAEDEMKVRLVPAPDKQRQ